jgi:NitT/TauT family transport system substrate-binding protein
MSKIFAIFLTIFVLHGAVHAADNIRLGIPGGGGHITLPIAHKRGFLKEEGIGAEIIRITGTVGTAALGSGEIDYFTNLGISVRAAIGGLPVRLVACNLATVPFVFMARPEFRSVRELKGQTIGVNNFGGVPDLISRMTLKHYGLDPEKEVKIILAGTAVEARLAAMKQGLIAATMVTVPFNLQASKMGFSVLARPYELFSFPDGGIVATVKKIKEKPDEIKRVIKAAIKANRYIRADRDGTILAVMEHYRTDRETAMVIYEFVTKALSEDGSLPENGTRLIIDEARKVTKTNREVPISEVADLSILREAQKELGIKGK